MQPRRNGKANSSLLTLFFSQISLYKIYNLRHVTSPEDSPDSEGSALGYPLKGIVYIAICLWEYWSAGVVARPGATCRDTSKTQPCIKKELIINSDFGGWSGPGSIGKAMNN